MGFEGTYKATKSATFVEGQGLVMVDIDKLLAETTDEGDRHILEQTARSLLRVDELGGIQYVMEIPEGTPAEEIERAKSAGMVVSDDGKYIVTKTENSKMEDGALYLHDASKFLTGSEWIKISTDVEDELNFITTLYKKI